MTSRRATPLATGDQADGLTSRAERRVQRRAARRATVRRATGLVATLVVGVSATAGGLSTGSTTLPAAAAAESGRTASELTDIGDAELAVAVRSARPVEGVLLTHAATAADQARIAAAVAAAVKASLTPRTGVNWDAIARCETGGNWSMRGSSYSGGLGFANTTWSGFGGGEFSSNAGLASREQQIVVAERVHARYGLSGWGCRRFG